MRAATLARTFLLAFALLFTGIPLVGPALGGLRPLSAQLKTKSTETKSTGGVYSTDKDGNLVHDCYGGCSDAIEFFDNQGTREIIRSTCKVVKMTVYAIASACILIAIIALFKAGKGDYSLWWTFVIMLFVAGFVAAPESFFHMIGLDVMAKAAHIWMSCLK